MFSSARVHKYDNYAYEYFKYEYFFYPVLNQVKYIKTILVNMKRMKVHTKNNKTVYKNKMYYPYLLLHIQANRIKGHRSRNIH